MSVGRIETAVQATRDVYKFQGTAEIRRNLHRKLVVVIVREAQERQPDLLEVAQALGTPGLSAGALNGGQQQRGKDRDDGDNDQQLDQRKSPSRPAHKEPN